MVPSSGQVIGSFSQNTEVLSEFGTTLVSKLNLQIFAAALVLYSVLLSVASDHPWGSSCSLYYALLVRFSFHSTWDWIGMLLGSLGSQVSNYLDGLCDCYSASLMICVEMSL